MILILTNVIQSMILQHLQEVLVVDRISLILMMIVLQLLSYNSKNI